MNLFGVSRRGFVAGLASVSVAGCSSRKFKAYNGPEVTRIVVNKGARHMYMISGKNIIRKYDVELGFSPDGHKRVEGDGRTPEGSYFIDRKNPRSSFYLSLGISYPNAVDRERARVLGKSPGGDIFIHGQRRPGDPKGPDWTAGCIAVNNREMRDIYAMVKTGTRIDIFP